MGDGPYWLSPWLSWTQKTMRMIVPTTGMRPMRSHQPLRLVSCSRRTATARDGRTIASPTMAVMIPFWLLVSARWRMDATMVARIVKS